MKRNKPQRHHNSQLTPIQMEDKNGHMVTRWVKLLPSGEPALNIPSPQSPALTRFATDSFHKLFPEVEEESGYLKDRLGSRWFYTKDFVVDALESLPPKTLRKLNDLLTGVPDGKRDAQQEYLMLGATAYLNAMYNNCTMDETTVQSVYEVAVVKMNNCLLFHEVIHHLASTEQYNMSGGDYEYLLGRELQRYEGVRSGVDEDYSSKTDYSTLPKRKQNEVIANLMAQYLTREFTSHHYTVEPEFVKFLYDHIDRKQEVIALVVERSANDVGALRAVMDSGVSALSSGAL